MLHSEKSKLCKKGYSASVNVCMKVILLNVENGSCVCKGENKNVNFKILKKHISDLTSLTQETRSPVQWPVLLVEAVRLHPTPGDGAVQHEQGWGRFSDHSL